MNNQKPNMMKQIKTVTLCIALIGLTVVACQKDDSIDSLSNELDRTSVTHDLPEGPWVEKISGSGHYMVQTGIDTFDQRTFTVTAHKDANGNVTGQWTRIRRQDGNASDSHSHGIVECFVIDGDYAWVGVEATGGLFSEPGFADGGFRLYDGGNPGAGNDSLSLEFVGRTDGFATIYCDATANTPALRPLEQGNIKIQIR